MENSRLKAKHLTLIIIVLLVIYIIGLVHF